MCHDQKEGSARERVLELDLVWVVEGGESLLAVGSALSQQLPTGGP